MNALNWIVLSVNRNMIHIQFQFEYFYYAIWTIEDAVYALNKMKNEIHLNSNIIYFNVIRWIYIGLPHHISIESQSDQSFIVFNIDCCSVD